MLLCQCRTPERSQDLPMWVYLQVCVAAHMCRYMYMSVHHMEIYIYIYMYKYKAFWQTENSCKLNEFEDHKFKRSSSCICSFFLKLLLI